MPLRRCLAAVLLSACAPAMAQQPAPSAGQAPSALAASSQVGPDLAGRAARRFPQPVRVGDLIGRRVLRPIEAQDVLGRVVGVARRSDGAVLIVVGLGGALGFGTRPVAVPVEATALLGEHLVVVDLTPEQLRALPTFTGAETSPIPTDETIRVGLTRPFH